MGYFSSSRFKKLRYLLLSAAGGFLIYNFVFIYSFVLNGVTILDWRSDGQAAVECTGYHCEKTAKLDHALPHRPPLITSITNRSLYSSTKSIKPPGVLLKLKGGLGNQLFEYACHYAIARKHDWPLYIFETPAKKISPNRTFGIKKREFALDQFHIPLHPWNIVDDTWNISFVHPANDSVLLSGSYPLNKVVRLAGGDYCQSESFFAPYKNELLEYFEFNITPVQQWIDVIDQTEESVAVHIRRGDFVRLNVSLPLHFYTDCMYKIVERLSGRNVSFFVFSDDMEYVKNKFFLNDPYFLEEYHVFLVSDGNYTNVQELQLMSRCKHQIISCSTFSWWGAYLNKNPEKIVYAAHIRTSLIEHIYKGEVRKEFFKWEFGHIYYPLDWNAVHANWDLVD